MTVVDMLHPITTGNGSWTDGNEHARGQRLHVDNDVTFSRTRQCSFLFFITIHYRRETRLRLTSSLSACVYSSCARSTKVRPLTEYLELSKKSVSSPKKWFNSWKFRKKFLQIRGNLRERIRGLLVLPIKSRSGIYSTAFRIYALFIHERLHLLALLIVCAIVLHCCQVHYVSVHEYFNFE